MTDSRKFRIEGKVQGVWFRESTRQQAVRLGLTGHARNCADGTVEVVAFGSAEALSALRDWLDHGPPMAEVSKVAELSYEGPVAEDFLTG